MGDMDEGEEGWFEGMRRGEWFMGGVKEEVRGEDGGGLVVVGLVMRRWGMVMGGKWVEGVMAMEGVVGMLEWGVGT